MKGNRETDVKFHENNRVIIRIWTSSFNKEMPGENVGHISVEALDTYMSLWPARRRPTNDTREGKISSKLKKIFEERPPHYMCKYKEDRDAEDRDPEYVFCLYSLDQEAIIGEFDKLKRNIQGWTLLGGNILINSGASESCATLAYKLLKAGGIYNLISASFSSENSVVTNPDSLSRASIAAKEYESEHYPETKDYAYEGETKLNPSSEDKKCLMM
jgi:hypothetical protein